MEFNTFLFSGPLEAWWTSILKGRQVGLPPITWEEFSIMFRDRFIPLSKEDNMRCQLNDLWLGSMTIIKYDSKFTNLSRFVPFLVVDQRKKVRQFVDGLEFGYHGPVIQGVRNGSYTNVVGTSLCSESYFEVEGVNRESKKAHNSGGFSSAPSKRKSDFYHV